MTIRLRWENTIKPSVYLFFKISLFKELPEEVLVVFIVATAGQGEMPENARANWRRLLDRRLPPNLLADVRLAVVGLGDSSYTRYNWAAKKLYRRLVQLGAITQWLSTTPTAESPLTLADEQHALGVDATLEPWRQALWPALYKTRLFETPRMRLIVGRDELPPPKYAIEFSPLPSSHGEEYGATAANNGEGIDVPTTEYNEDFVEVRVLANERLTAPEHFQVYQMITF